MNGESKSILNESHLNNKKQRGSRVDRALNGITDLNLQNNRPVSWKEIKLLYKNLNHFNNFKENTTLNLSLSRTTINFINICHRLIIFLYNFIER